MIFRYGSYSHPDNECIVTFFGAAALYNDRGQRQTLRKTMVVEGEIVAATTAAINSRVAEIQNAYALQGGTAALLTSTGGATNFVLDSGGSISGTRIVAGPTFLMQDGKAHFATGLPFTITFEADYPISDLDGLVSYSETITRIGNGGPRRATLELDAGFPIEQIVSTNTPVTVIQTGEAVGSLSHPAINEPIFPTQVDLPDGLQISRASPRRDGISYVDWPVRWAYRMTLTQFAAIPNPFLR